MGELVLGDHKEFLITVSILSTEGPPLETLRNFRYFKIEFSRKARQARCQDFFGGLIFIFKFFSLI